MTAALRIAKTGLDALQTKMSVISNNLANVNTTAYKRSRLIFNDLLYQTIRQPGAQSSQNTTLPSGLMLGTGVRTVATEKIFSQGEIVTTEGSLDVAIAGGGFFEILMPDGSSAYTRDGSFHRDSQGQIVTANGFVLQPAITIPTNTETVTIGTDGTISALVSGSSSPTQIGNMQLTYFVSPAGLQPIGANLFKETGASGTAQSGTPGLTGLGTLIHGSLESSNVNVVEELVNMIETQRAYEMNSKAISTTDQMLQYASNNM